MITEPAPQHLGVVVVGAGFGGLAAAHALKGRGEDFAGVYLSWVAREHGLLPRIRFGCSPLEAAWDDAAQRWRIATSAGPLTAGMLIDASGPIADPSVPDLPGLASFAGAVFHSARWNHGDLTGHNRICR
jgi:cation diffusion facilitator CzcD-associated flavoprotein CzcO